VVNLSYQFCQPCCDGACTFGGVLWRDELHPPQSIFYGSKQPKSQFKNLVLDFKLSIELELMEGFENTYHS
jgi:hypothetical protein